MIAKVSELSNKLYWIQDENTSLEHIEAFNNCETTLSELKEMFEDIKLLIECEEYFGEYYKLAFGFLKRSPRKFTIQEVQLAYDNAYDKSDGNASDMLEYLTKIPQEGIAVEIVDNKIVKIIL